MPLPATGLPSPILVIGGTRGTGLLIAQSLTARGVPVRVLARDPRRAATRLSPRAEIVPGDMTKPVTLPRAVAGVSHVVLTAGCRSGRPVREARVKATEFEGVRNVIAAARAAGFDGRFLYMTSSGVTTRSLSTVLLNLYKGNTLVWRLHAEEMIRDSGLDYTIVRAGILVNGAAGERSIVVTQDALPLSIHYRIARGDVAQAFTAALDHPRARRATFDVVWGKGKVRQTWPELLQGLKPDAEKIVS